MKKILDACCGGRMMWFNKAHPLVQYNDIRSFEEKLSNGQTLRVKPDVVMDFRKMHYPDKSFKLVVFDPPHLSTLGKNSWMAKKYGILDESTWEKDLKSGFDECMRVLDDYGVLILKWSQDVSHPSRSKTIKQVLNVIQSEPLFGHPTGKNGQTIWMCFMKI